MTNILRNPTLSGFTLGRYFTEKNGSVGTIEYPLEWEFIAAIREMDDPEKLPQSLHRDQGFAISAGYRSWEGGFVQRHVPLIGGTRYMAKVGFVPHVGFSDGRVDLSAVTWRLMIETPIGTIAQDWQMTQKGSFDQYEELYLVFDCGQSTEASFHFQGRSPWAGNMCELQVFACSLENIANDGTPAPVIGQSSAFTASSPAPQSQPAALHQPPPPHVGPKEPMLPAPIGKRDNPPPAPIGMRDNPPPAPIGVREAVPPSPSVKHDPYALLNQLAAAPDFDTIVGTLQNAPQWLADANLAAGYVRLAEALKALKR